MTEENNDGKKENEGSNDNKEEKNLPEIEELIKKGVEDSLKPIKEKLDKAYGERDTALKKIAEHEKRERELELARLREEGKHKEAYELQIAEERAKREVLEKQNLELTRDNELRIALSGLNFRNEKALELAFQEIVGQLVRDENNAWVHRSGLSVRDFVRTLEKSEDHAFLFKSKQNSGSGTGGPGGPGSSGSGGTSKKSGSVFDLSQDEVLKRASEGTLRKRK